MVCCGETVEEAFLNTYYTVLACESQVNYVISGKIYKTICVFAAFAKCWFPSFDKFVYADEDHAPWS